MESVNILFGKDIIDDDLIVKMLGQRKLNKYAVDLVVLIELLNEGKQFLLCSLGGESVLIRCEANLFASLLLVSHIDL